MTNFVHLRSPTEYSIEKGTITIDSLIEKATNNNITSLAITDLSNMFGAMKFTEATIKAGIKPIFGCELFIEEDIKESVENITDLENEEKSNSSFTVKPKEKEPYNVIMLAKNEEGFKYLSSLVSRGQIENVKNKSAVKKSWLIETFNNNPELHNSVVVLSGAKNGLIGQEILSGNQEKAKEISQEWNLLFPNNFYIELQRDATENENLYLEGALQICSDLNIAPVATHPNLFLNKEDFVAHEVKTCIVSSETLYDRSRVKVYNKEQYFKTKEEMEELFIDIPIALENTYNISQQCNYSIASSDPKLPNFPIPEGSDINRFFKEEVFKGYKNRMLQQFPNEADRLAKNDEYIERLKLEVNTIVKMGFPGYFLIVADVIQWAKEQKLPIGPGRGSAAGSLVAYCLGITDIDPIKYTLLFERFLNPERVSMPDIDTDISAKSRETVLEYIKKKYTEEKVAQIVTFGTYAAKNVIKDVGRVLNYPYGFNDSVSRMINIPANKKISLQEFVDSDAAIQERMENEPQVKKMIDISLKLTGLVRNTGVGPAGVVISPTKITDFSPLHKRDDGAALVTQFEISDIEKTGLIKFDFLGISTLDIINDCVKLVNKKEKFKDIPFNISTISTEDLATYQNLAEGNTVGIFQFESPLMVGLLKQSNQSNFNNLMMVTSIGRPGPLDYVPEWLERLHGRKPIEYPHELLRGILEPTQGIMIYQEQVMQTAQIVAGYSLGQADLLRRAMGKKKVEEMAKQRETFIEGSKKNNLTEEQANHIFDTMEKFAGYGFNKSHAAAYSMLSYQTAYLKTHFPTEFYTSLMNAAIGDQAKLGVFIEDMTKNGVEILPPDVNKSSYEFTIEEEGQIRYGLGAIKTMAENSSEAIIKGRIEKGNYTDFYDFLEKVEKGKLRKNSIESLVKSGTFDELHSNRASVYSAIEPALDYIKAYTKREQNAEGPLEGVYFLQGLKKKKKELVELVKPVMQELDEWNSLEKLSYEKAVLGLYLSGNPYNSYLVKLNNFNAAVPLPNIQEKYEQGEKKVVVAGVIQDIIWWKSKKGGDIRISDGKATQDVMFYSNMYDENKDWLKEEQFITFQCKLSNHFKGEGFGLTAEAIYNFEDTKKLLTKKIYAAGDISDVDQFTEICKKYPGNIESSLCVFDNNTGRKTKKEVTLKVNYSLNLIEELQNKFGENNVKNIYFDKIDTFDVDNGKGKKSKFKN